MSFAQHSKFLLLFLFQKFQRYIKSHNLLKNALIEPFLQGNFQAIYHHYVLINSVLHCLETLLIYFTYIWLICLTEWIPLTKLAWADLLTSLSQFHEECLCMKHCSINILPSLFYLDHILTMNWRILKSCYFLDQLLPLVLKNKSWWKMNFNPQVLILLNLEY